MKTGKLFEFSVESLPEALGKAFGAEAIKDFDEQNEVQCGSCLHKTTRLFVVAETKLQGLRAINKKKMGLCGDCVAGLIATEGWKVVSAGDRF